jgi:hypothetical protein
MAAGQAQDAPDELALADCRVVLGQAGAIDREPLAAQSVSLTRRLSRFLDNKAIRPAVRFRPVARQLLAPAAQRPLTLIVDASKVSR